MDVVVGGGGFAGLSAARERRGYRALWFGRELTPGPRAADRDNKAALAGGLERVLRTLGLGEGADLETAARAGVRAPDQRSGNIHIPVR